MAQDYNNTLNLPKTDFPMRAGLICIGLGGMIVMPVIRCIWRGCVSLFNKFTNFVHRFVSSKAVA